MSHKLLLFLISISFILLLSCKKKEYDISAVCEKNDARAYVLKWETFPVMPGNVKIYRSDNPDDFTEKEPAVELPVQKGIAVMKKDSLLCNYFKLVFGKQQTIVSNRAFSADSIINLRELGGYYNESGHQVKWGKIYRSGDLSHATKQDIALIRALHIKTAIDLRTHEEIAKFSSASFFEQTFHLPLKGFDSRSLVQKVINGQMKKGDVLIYQQDLHASIIKENTDNFKQYFEILADSSNYPIIIYCGLGKDRTGIVAAMTLSVLGVNDEQIYQDYMLSNYYMDLTKIVRTADTLSSEIQETLTALLGSKQIIIEYAGKYVEKQYGSFNNYFEKELKMTNKQRQKLKEILLYENNPQTRTRLFN